MIVGRSGRRWAKLFGLAADRSPLRQISLGPTFKTKWHILSQPEGREFPEEFWEPIAYKGRKPRKWNLTDRDANKC